MKKVLTNLCAFSLLLGLSLSCQPGGSTKADLKTDDDKAFYSLGVMFGGRLKDVKLSANELALVKQGLSDSATGKKPLIKAADHRAAIDKIFKGRITEAVKVAKDDGKKYRDGLKGYQKTASGLMYKIERPGSAKKPGATDTVEVHYKGTLIDGTTFDSSYDRKKTINFPLNRVIPGWTEGLQLIGEGGKVNLVIPSDLAYGDRGAPPNVPGGSTLVFDVELMKVNGAKAAPAPAAGNKAVNAAKNAASKAKDTAKKMGDKAADAAKSMGDKAGEMKKAAGGDVDAAIKKAQEMKESMMKKAK